MTHLRSLAFTSLAVLSLVACAQDPEDDAVVFEQAKSSLARNMSESLAPADAETFTRANTDSALDLHRKLAAKGGNLALSPSSIQRAMAMAWAGADGATADEITQALRFDLGKEKTHVGWNALARSLASRSGDGKSIDGSPLKLEVNDAFFGQKGFAFEAPYLDALSGHYGAGVMLADFAGNAKEETARINTWVSKRTNDRIQNFLGGLNPLTRAVLVDTVYFNAGWETPFEESATQTLPFTNESGGASSVTMMGSKRDMSFVHDESVDAVTLRYSGGKLAMTVLAPRKGTLADFERSLDTKGLAAIDASRHTGEVDLHLPKFKLDGDTISVKETLQALGAKRAFELGAADFSGITKSDRLVIADVFHKVFIDVAEKGTEAAAASGVIGMAPSMPVDNSTHITFDRPFLVVIRDEPTGAILFTARIADARSAQQ